MNRMKVFCVFDDFPQKDISLIRSNCMDLDILPKGQTRPSGEDLKQLLLKYDALIIGTGQRLQEDFFYDISNRKYIVTASTGVDHIKVPENKKDFIKIINAPTAIFSTVAEHIFAFIFAQEKLLFPAREVAFAGKHKNAMEYPPPSGHRRENNRYYWIWTCGASGCKICEGILNGNSGL